MKRFIIALAITFSLCTGTGKAQYSMGTPHITNYSMLDYKGGTQNWDIQQDQEGVLYFANNEGLLTFNGRYWRLHPLPNKTIVRSLRLSADGRVYVGGQDEIGFFYPNEHGILRYTSLKPLIPSGHRNFADVWGIEVDGPQVLFRTTDKIFRLKDDKVQVYQSENEWEYVGKTNGKLFVQDLRKGLLQLRNGVLDLVCDDPRLRNVIITSILPYHKDSLLLTTLRNGLYILHNSTLNQLSGPLDALLRESRIFKAVAVGPDLYALGTTSSALLIINKRGEPVQRFSSENGLQKNNIRSIFVDRDKNIWLGLDNGIDYIAYNSAIKTIYPDRAKQATSYSTLITGSRLYIGTSNGVYVSPIDGGKDDISFSSGKFSEVANTSGQVWNLTEINGQLLMGHEDGAFIIERDKARPLYVNPGTWLFQTLSVMYPSDKIIAGTYNGLQQIEFKAGAFRDMGTMASVEEPLRFLTYDPDRRALWASHPYRGVYRFQLSADRQEVKETSLFTREHGLPLTLYNYVFYVKNRIVVATSQGIYEFDQAKKRFHKSPLFQAPFKDLAIEYLKEDPDGNVWFVTNKKVGVVDFQKKTAEGPFSVIYFPELNAKIVAGFVSIYPFNRKNIFIGSNRGVFHINYEKYARKIDKPSVLLGQVKLAGKKDSVLFGGYGMPSKGQAEGAEDNPVVLPYQFNSLHFEYSSSLFEYRDNIEFSFQLAGFDKEWSDWSSKSEKDYTNLPAGTYTFYVKARNNLGSESTAAAYTFKIKPAWYRTYWVYALYACLLGGMLYLVIKWQQKKHADEQRRLKYLHQLELERNEKQIVKLRNEKLEAEVSFKNKELATATMHLVQRGKLLSKIKAELIPIVETEAKDGSPVHVKRALQLLEESEKRDADWQQFAIHFDKVHSNFLSNLKEKYPNLSPNDLKLCAYLKMNLSTKEMAQLMNITIRGVEVSRYRLRKKLNVSTETNLFDFLMQASSQN